MQRESIQSLLQIAMLLLAIFAVLPAGAQCSIDHFVSNLRRQFPDRDPETECQFSRVGGSCQNFSQRRNDEAHSACVNVHIRIKNTIQRYAEKVADYCARSEEKLRTCTPMQGSNRDSCMANHARYVAEEETKLANDLMESQDRLMRYEERARFEKDKYVGAWRTLYPSGRPLPTAATPIPSDMQDCLGRRPNPADYLAMLRPVDLANPDSSPIVRETTKALQTAELFRQQAFNSAKRHQDTTKAFVDNAKKFDDLARRNQNIEKKGPSDNNKSDITGGDQKGPPQQQAGGPPPGGGGPPPGGGSGGGQPGGGSSPSSLGTGSTPPSSNPLADSSQGDKKNSNTLNKLGSAKPGSGKPTEGEGKMPDFARVSGLNGSGVGGGGMGLGSRGPASDGSNGSRNGGASAASSSSPGGGGGGLGDSGGSNKPCLGKDCQQALGGVSNNQFASAGSLGGGGGGMDNLDTNSALDNLFKSDEAKAGGEPGAGDALGALEGGELGDLGADMNAGTEEGAGNGGIGGVDGGDLFERVRITHIRHQKRGNVAGITKKL